MKKSAELFPGSNVFPDEDQKYVERMKNGDHKAFKKLYDKYKGQIMTYLSAVTKNQGIGEDLTQEVFLKVYRFSHALDPNLKFAPWLWTVARNAALDHLRKKGEILASKDDSVIENLESADLPADCLLIKRADSQKVQKCLESLTDAQREALVLRTVSELSYEEIALTLKVSLASIKSLINRAKATLIDCVGGKSL